MPAVSNQYMLLKGSDIYVHMDIYAIPLRYLAKRYSMLQTAFTYHRTWEIGLEKGTRVPDSGPSFFISKIPTPMPGLKAPLIKCSQYVTRQ